MATPFPAAAGRGRLEEFDGSWSSRQLTTGMRVVHVPVPYSEVFLLGLLVRGGSRFESRETSGAAHFLEHMMFRGSSRYPEYMDLAEAFERLGGDWNAATGREYAEFSYGGISHTAPEAISLFADFLETPQFRDIESERKVILRELDGETNELGHNTDPDVHLAELVWPGSTLAQPILGDERILKRISVDTISAHRDRLYVPQNQALYVVGGPESAAVLDLVEEVFAGHRAPFAAVPPPPFPPIARFAGPAVRWVENPDNEYEVRLGFVCDGGAWSQEAPLYEVLARILADGFSSRLTRRLREELGLVYDIDAEHGLYSDTGTFEISSTVRWEQFDKFFGELFETLQRLVVDGPTADETERAVFRSKVELELMPLELGGSAFRLAWDQVNGQSRPLVRERRILDDVTPERVRATAAELFRQARAALVVLGPKERGIEQRLGRYLRRGLPA